MLSSTHYRTVITANLVMTRRQIDRKKKWELVERKFKNFDKLITNWLVPLFRDEEKRYIREVRSEFRKHVKSPDTVIEAINRIEIEQRQTWTDESSVFFSELLDEAGLFGLRRAGLSADLWDLLNSEVLRYLDEKVFNFAGGITNTTASQLRDTLREAITEGESINEMVARIRRVFDGTVRGDTPRTRMIARTESTGIVNGGTRLSYQQNPDIIQQIEWLSSRDARVRPTHTAADGQRVGLNESFNIGGALMRHPGDPQGPAREVINCRCTVLPVLE